MTHSYNTFDQPQVLAYENAPVLVSSNFRIDLRPMISKARLLPPPDVLYRGNARVGRTASS